MGSRLELGNMGPGLGVDVDLVEDLELDLIFDFDLDLHVDLDLDLDVHLDLGQDLDLELGADFGLGLLCGRGLGRWFEFRSGCGLLDLDQDSDSTWFLSKDLVSIVRHDF